MFTNDFDDFDNIIEETNYNWDIELGELVPHYKETFTFDMDYPSSVIMAPEGYAEYFKHMALTVKLLIFVNGVWNEIQTSTLHYSPVNITSADNRVEADFQVYPNPFRETIRFKGSDEMMQFTLADLQGRVVLRSKVTGTSEISTLGIPSGMYIYQVEGMNFKYAGKLVKE